MSVTRNFGIITRLQVQTVPLVILMQNSYKDFQYYSSRRNVWWWNA